MLIGCAHGSLPCERGQGTISKVKTMIEKKAWAGWKLKNDQERKQFRRGVALEECVKKDPAMTEGIMHRLQVSFDITTSQALQFHSVDQPYQVKVLN